MCTSIKICEEESLIVRTFQDIVDLAEHSNKLIRKIITFECIFIEPKMEKYLRFFACIEYPEHIIYRKCVIDDTGIDCITIPCYYDGKTSAINNCKCPFISLFTSRCKYFIRLFK